MISNSKVEYENRLGEKCLDLVWDKCHRLLHARVPSNLDERYKRWDKIRFYLHDIERTKFRKLQRHPQALPAAYKKKSNDVWSKMKRGVIASRQWAKNLSPEEVAGLLVISAKKYDAKHRDPSTTVPEKKRSAPDYSDDEVEMAPSTSTANANPPTSTVQRKKEPRLNELPEETTLMPAVADRELSSLEHFKFGPKSSVMTFARFKNVEKNWDLVDTEAAYSDVKKAIEEINNEALKEGEPRNFVFN